VNLVAGKGGKVDDTKDLLGTREEPSEIAHFDTSPELVPAGPRLWDN